MHKFRDSLERPNLPTIPVLTPSVSPTKNSHCSTPKIKQKPSKDFISLPSSDSVTLGLLNDNLRLSFDDISNKDTDDEDKSTLFSPFSPTSPIFLNKNSKSLSLSDHSSTDNVSDDPSKCKAKTSAIKIRKRAKFYLHKRGSSLYAPPTPLSGKELSPVGVKQVEDDDEDKEDENEKYISKVIIVQSVVRRFLIYNKIRNYENNRIKERQKLEEELNIKYNEEIERITSIIQQHLPCIEYDEAVELFNQYVNDIEKNEICNNEQEEKLKYLFYICSEDTSKSLNINEFHVLTNEIMKLSTPDYSYILLFPDEFSKVEFIPFLLWFKTSKEKGVSQDNYITSKIKNMFKQKSFYPYINHIKISLHSKIVNSALSNYDKMNKPLFQCPICKLTTMLPKDLSKHIVQCRYDKVLSKVDFDLQF